MNKELFAQHAQSLFESAIEVPETTRSSREFRPENLQAERQTPLADRLKKQLDKIPKDVKEKGLLLAEIKPLCTGRYRRTTPHPGHVAEALSKLGWWKTRSWATGSTRQTLWYPPR